MDNSNFSKLLGEVCKQKINPEDKYEVAAIIESLGWNDSMVRESFGVPDIFELSEQLLGAIRKKVFYFPYAYIVRPPLWQYILTLVKAFLRGAIFALPMVVSVAAMLTLRFSLWSYYYLSLEDATSIAVGTILSFVAIGGFTQTIGYWGFRFIIQNYYFMARKIVFFHVRLGFLLSIAVAIFVLIINYIFQIFSWRMILIADGYFLFLSLIWLSVTVMYILQREFLFTGFVAGGIGLVYIFFKIIGLNIIFSQLISLTIVAITGVIMAVYFFHKAEKAGEKGISPSLPRLPVVFHISIPYFAYGFLYFAFLFLDRIIAWSTNNAYMPYFIWFRGDYELGLDFALLAFIIPMGLVEAIVTDFMTNLEANQKNHAFAEVGKLKKLYLWEFYRRTIYLVILAFINAILVYYIVHHINSFFHTDVIVLSSITEMVFIWALAAYFLISIGLMNSLILFSFSQPNMTYKPIVFACFTNIFLGFILSRWFHYSWAIYGLFVGALVFAVLSFLQARKLFKNMDYYLYSAL